MKTVKLPVDNIGHIQELRQYLGLQPNNNSRDFYIENMTPFERVRALAKWHFGNEYWADIWKEYCESQGIYWTTDVSAKGILHRGGIKIDAKR